jgi:hypothetical protein
VTHVTVPGLTEKALQAHVLDLAQLFGWLAYHTFDARRSEPGFPDVVLVRERVLFVELKTERGRLSPAQVEWLRALLGAGAEVYLVRPRNLDVVAAVLSGRGPSVASAELRTELAIEVAP